MKKTVSTIYDILLGIGIVLMLISLICAKAKLVDPSESATELLASETQIDQDIREYTLHLNRTADRNNCVAFFSVHQYIWVYEDGKLLYSVEDGETIFGTTPGGGWHFVEVDPNGQEITVRLQAVYPQVRDYQVSFYQGDGIQIYLDIMRGSVLEVLVSILDLTIGIVFLVYCMVARKEIAINRGAVYFGVFTILMGVWSLNETEMMTVLADNRVAASFIGYTLIMLMIAPFVFFVREFLMEKREWMSYVIAIASYVNAVVCTVLHLTGILEFKQTVSGTHLLMLVALLYLTYALICRIRKGKFDRKVGINLLGLGILVAAFVVDIAAYYMGARKTDVFGRFGFLMYIVLLGLEVSKSLVSGVKEGRKAQIYRELAVKDMLTGLYNRNAYNEWLERNAECSGMTILTFDLNELKHCNDTMGHRLGDKYIKDAAGLLAKVFEPAGKCYRIGGDEFCVLVENAHTEWIEERIRMLEMLERNYNKAFPQIHMQIAHGYATFDGQKDSSLEDTRNRADEQMYENKKNLKQGKQ